MKRNSNNLIYSLMLIVLVLMLMISCKKDEVLQLPVVTTTQVSNIKSTSAISGGVITNEGNVKIIACGVCWSTTPNPTIKDNRTNDSIENGNFTSLMKGLISDTTYYVRAYATNINGTSYGLMKTIKTQPSILAIIITNEPSNINGTTALCGGNITFDGNSIETSKGICWSQDSNPTYDNDRIYFMFGSGVGTYTCSMAGLKPNTTYYVRAFAQNNAGISYGGIFNFKTNPQSDGIVFNPDLTYGSMTDIDGNTYKTITIGTQTWMAENLRTTTYRDGNSVTGFSYKNDKSYVTHYGRLYDWFAVSSTSNLAPTGWHVATDAEWTILINYLIKSGCNLNSTLENNVAQSLAATTDWGFDPIIGNVGNDLTKNNKSGFTALPSGNFMGSSDEFYNLGYAGFWWTSTEDGPYSAKDRQIDNDFNVISSNSDTKNLALSVRCVKD